MKRSVIHITPHLGGGVGSVLLNYLAKAKTASDFSHKIFSLEYANEKSVKASGTTGFFLKDKMSGDHEGLLSAAAQADIVLIHWWNHPLLFALLVREAFPPARIIFWSHISGLHPPYVFNEPALEYPDLFVFTSPVSFKTHEVVGLQQAKQERLRVIWSTGGVEHMTSIKPKPHKGFNIGYIGTVDYGKLHARFLDMCLGVDIPDVRFTVCGGSNEKEIQGELTHQEDRDQFTFTGAVADIKPYLAEFDIFGYPLAPYHYGTCEQVLGESMAAGIPPVVLANPTESYIVEDGTTGLVARNEESYARAIESLYHNPDLRTRLANNACEAARKIYSLDLMVQRWEKVFGEALRFPKTSRAWAGRFRGKLVSAAQVFVESLGNYGCEFEKSLTAKNEQENIAALDNIKKLYASSQLWKTKTRGTANHYSYFFPNDDHLKVWASLTNNEHIMFPIHHTQRGKS